RLRRQVALRDAVARMLRRPLTHEGVSQLIGGAVGARAGIDLQDGRHVVLHGVLFDEPILPLLNQIKKRNISSNLIHKSDQWSPERLWNSGVCCWPSSRRAVTPRRPRRCIAASPR